MSLFRQLSFPLAQSWVLTVSALAQTPRGPSTPEERARITSVAQALRADPLGATAANSAWFEQWISDVPDYTRSPDAIAQWCERSAKGELRVCRLMTPANGVSHGVQSVKSGESGTRPPAPVRR